MNFKKNVIVLYQDWGNWFIKNQEKFFYWFDKLDEAYSKEFNYYIIVLGSENKKFKLKENIFVEIIKSKPQTQFLQFKKLKSRLKELKNEFKPNFLYCPFLYLSSQIPLKEYKNVKKIGFLRDKTGEMISAKGGYKYLIGKFFLFFDYLAMKKLDIILHNGKSLSKYAKDLGFKGKLIYNPRPIADKEKYTKVKPDKRLLNITKNKKVILSVGRLVKGKNHQLGIKALSNLPKEYILIILGEGEEKDNLLKLAKRLNVEDRVFLEGFVKHENIWKYYKVANIFWLLSKTDFEGTPNVLQEAFYAKVPVVVSKIDAMKNIIEDKKNGLILKRFDEKELSNKTLNLVDDKKIYKKIQKEQDKKIKEIIKKHKKVIDFFN